MESVMNVQVTEMTGETLEFFRTALESAGLSTDDIDLPGRSFFQFALDGITVGWGGFEAYGEDGLLRSMVVRPDHRSKGVGSATLKIIERFAADRRVTRLHLLTTSASSFFGQHGYEVLQRGAEPLLISQTRQFKDPLHTKKDMRAASPSR